MITFEDHYNKIRDLTTDGDTPKPTEDAIARAGEILRWAEKDKLVEAWDVTVDADAMGGVALHFYSEKNKTAWVACMNSGATTVVLSERGKEPVGMPWNEESKQKTLFFLLRITRVSTYRGTTNVVFSPNIKSLHKGTIRQGDKSWEVIRKDDEYIALPIDHLDSPEIGDVTFEPPRGSLTHP